MLPTADLTQTNNATEIPIVSCSLADPASGDRAESMLNMEYNNGDSDCETIFVDERKVVKPEYIRHGGKYRSKSLLNIYLLALIQ